MRAPGQAPVERPLHTPSYPGSLGAVLGARRAEKADYALLVTRVLLGAGLGALPRLKRTHGASFSPWQPVVLYPYEQCSGGAVVSKQIVYRPPELL